MTTEIVNWKTLVEGVLPADILQLRKVFIPRIDFKGVKNLRVLATKVEKGVNSQHKPECVLMSDKSKDFLWQVRKVSSNPLIDCDYKCVPDDTEEIRIRSAYEDDDLASVFPAVYINLDKYIKLMESSSTFEIFADTNNNRNFPSIMFGMYPRTVNGEICCEFFNKLKNSDESIKYLGEEKGYNFPYFKSYYYNPNYERYGCWDGYTYKSKPMAKYDVDGQIMLFDDFSAEVKILEPFVMRIANWENLPTSINPKGDGTAKHLIVIPNGFIFNETPPSHDEYLPDGGNFVNMGRYDEICEFLNTDFIDAVFGFDIPFTIEKKTAIEKKIAAQKRLSQFEQNNSSNQNSDSLNKKIEELEIRIDNMGAGLNVMPTNYTGREMTSRDPLAMMNRMEEELGDLRWRSSLVHWEETYRRMM